MRANYSFQFVFNSFLYSRVFYFPAIFLNLATISLSVLAK